tara:strand:- start:62 stop:499 length:438 start_codon:yes stop_codon:yes gene_type:complete
MANQGPELGPGSFSISDPRPEWERQLPFIHKIGYKWVNSSDRWYLLMRSIRCEGGAWWKAKEELEKPRNIEYYKHGPNPREGWVDEIDTIEQQRKPKVDYSKLEHLTWQEKMMISLNSTDHHLNSEEMEKIRNKWYGIHAGRISW